MLVHAEDFGNGARHNFWLGYEWGLAGKLPSVNSSEYVWSGFGHGHIEKEGWFRITKWQARFYRAKRFSKALWSLLCSYRKGLDFGTRERNGILEITVLLGKW